MKSKKLFSCFVASAVALASVLAPAKPAQAQWASFLGSIPYAGGYISTALDVASRRTTPLEAVGAHVPGVGGQVLGYVNHGINIATGRESVVEGVLGIVGGSVGGVAGSVLGHISSGIRTARNIGMIRSQYLYYGERVERQWHVRDSQGHEVSVEAKEWKLSYTDGEAKFILVLMDGQEKEYPIEGLYHEDDLKYLCRYILNKLGEEIPQTETANRGSEIQKIKSRLDAIANKDNKEEARTELKVFFNYLNDELSSVSIGMMKIAAGTKAGEEMTLTIRGERYTFRWCPEGSFVRTALTQNHYGRVERQNEQQVKLSRGFWLLDSEVTRQKYDRVVQMRVGSNLPNPQQPMTGITWTNASDFCKQLEKITEKKFRLPTEAEWEYACRAGSRNVIADPAEISKVAWFAETPWTSYNGYNNGYYNTYNVSYNRSYYSNSNNLTAAHDVKEKKANAWGLYDMQGNVWEWCSDWYGNYGDTDVTDPKGPVTGQYRVARGGSYMSSAEECQPGYRYQLSQNNRTGALGFRVVLVPDPAEETNDTVAESTPDNNVRLVADIADDNTPDTVSSVETENTRGFTVVSATEDLPAVPEGIFEGDADEVTDQNDDQDVSIEEEEEEEEEENTEGFTAIDESTEVPVVSEDAVEENTDEVTDPDQADDQDVNEKEENTEGFTAVDELTEDPVVSEDAVEENTDEVTDPDQTNVPVVNETEGKVKPEVKKQKTESTAKPKTEVKKQSTVSAEKAKPQTQKQNTESVKVKTEVKKQNTVSAEKAKPQIQKQNTESVKPKTEVKKQSTESVEKTKTEVKKQNTVSAEKTKPEVKKQNTASAEKAKPQIQKQNTESVKAKPQIQKQNIVSAEKTKPQIQKQNTESAAKAKPQIQKQNTVSTVKTKPEIKKQKTESAVKAKPQIQKQNTESAAKAKPQIQKQSTESHGKTKIEKKNITVWSENYKSGKPTFENDKDREEILGLISNFEG